MITPFDDYPIHQTSDPLARPAQSDRNFYGRYWMNGFDRAGAFVFEVGFGQYPNRFVQDGHFSVVVDGVQHSFHASRRAPADRSETVAGPLRIEIVEPLRRLRVRLEPNTSGIECDLEFRARTVPTEEPKNFMLEGSRVIMDTSRFTQFGRWQGQFTVGGVRREVRAETTLGTRDRSWGVRPVGESPGGAPAPAGGELGIYWVWSPIHFDDVCTQFLTFEDRDGRPSQVAAAIVPTYPSVEAVPQAETRHREMASAKHRIRWERGTRRPASADLELISHGGETLAIHLEPIARFQLLGIGYQHPEWGHGLWKGEEAVGHESWRLADLDPLDYRHIHVHQICRATMGERTGVGTIETLVFGRHAPSGFKDFLDGAA